MRKLEEEKKCSGLSPVHVSVHLLGRISRGFGFCYLGKKLLHNSYSAGVKKILPMTQVISISLSK